ncbi:hypothetical protein JHK86_010085 [Glycine max]|nr:hypothetical protein JHK86_010085 [Glycine max]
MPVGDSTEGLRHHFLWLEKSMKNGSRANNSNMKLGVHTGTHVDAPDHFYDNYYDASFDVDSLDLTLLNAEVMKSLNIPRGVSRVLFRTLNTDRLLENGEGVATGGVHKDVNACKNVLRELHSNKITERELDRAKTDVECFIVGVRIYDGSGYT